MIVAFTALAGFLLLTRAQTALLAQKLNRLQRQQFARRNAAIEH
jgi:hypothetical protein